jgi:hypothetical protein
MRRGDRVLDRRLRRPVSSRGWHATRRPVTALDIDPAAVGMFSAGRRGESAATRAQIDRTFDVVVANLPDAELRRCLPSLVAAAGRVLVVTGGPGAGVGDPARSGRPRSATASSLDGWYCSQRGARSSLLRSA